MSESFDFDPVERVTASALGEPGDRTFFVQARAGQEQLTLVAEKEQVRLLGQALIQLLGTLPDVQEGIEPDQDDMELEEPIEPEWRVGEISIEHEESTNRVAIVITELLEDEDEGLPARARLVASRAQARALATHALEVVAAGRPRCQFCGYPLDPEGHICPAMNGHRSYQDE